MLKKIIEKLRAGVLGFLVIERYKGEKIIIVNEEDESQNIVITIMDVRQGNKPHVRIGIDAPKDIVIIREEFYQEL